MIILEKDRITTIKLNRPRVRNALNPDMIIELIETLNSLKDDESIRVIILTGVGSSFSSGADLDWLKEIGEHSYEQNLSESAKFVELVNTIHNFPVPIISMVNGPAIGAGAGIALASDIVVASKTAVFGISEVAIGIVPAAIIPLVKSRLGETKSREYLITGERIDAQTASKIGMINYTVNDYKLEDFTKEIAERIVKNGPKAVKRVREMITKVDHLSGNELNEYLTKEVAEVRTSEEGREGMRAFLEKRKPNWRV